MDRSNMKTSRFAPRHRLWPRWTEITGLVRSCQEPDFIVHGRWRLGACSRPTLSQGMTVQGYAGGQRRCWFGFLIIAPCLHHLLGISLPETALRWARPAWAVRWLITGGRCVAAVRVGDGGRFAASFRAAEVLPMWPLSSKRRFRGLRFHPPSRRPLCQRRRSTAIPAEWISQCSRQLTANFQRPT